jgi:hypothetical protein
MESNGLSQVSARPIRSDVRGAPFRIGEVVSIVGSKDETFESRYRGRVGTIRYFEYACGCGQAYPGDPMIGVGFRGGRVEEFWKEELKHFRVRIQPRVRARERQQDAAGKRVGTTVELRRCACVDVSSKPRPLKRAAPNRSLSNPPRQRMR